jgi:hypothetical protein
MTILFISRRNGLDCSISFTTNLDKTTATWAHALCKSNMEKLYDDSGYGWCDLDKEDELVEHGGAARFLIVTDNTDKRNAAYVHFRFTLQGEAVGIPGSYHCGFLPLYNAFSSLCWVHRGCAFAVHHGYSARTVRSKKGTWAPPHANYRDDCSQAGLVFIFAIAVRMPRRRLIACFRFCPHIPIQDSAADGRPTHDAGYVLRHDARCSQERWRQGIRAERAQRLGERRLRERGTDAPWSSILRI